MLSLEEAQSWVLSRVAAGPVVEVPLADAVGLTLASPAHALEDVPPFANTAMDGIAVRAADVTTVPVELRVTATIRAGMAAIDPVLPGTAQRIMTGAPIPPGADAIVPVEELQDLDAHGTVVRVLTAASVGSAIRPAGEDLHAGQLAFDAGTVLGAGHLGVLATIGLATAQVHRRPRVGVISTGDELVQAPAPLGPGQIRDSNRQMIISLLQQTGCDTVDLGCIPDVEDEIRDALASGIRDCDAVISSGGVSMGDFDYVKAVLRSLAAESGDPDAMRWMQIAIKPAKPLAFGVINGTPVFGLPGNPVSSMVSFELFARPALRKMMGVPETRLHRSALRVTAPNGLARRPDGKTHFVRVSVEAAPDGELIAEAVRGQGSNLLYSMALANGLAVVPDGTGVEPGGTARVLLLADPGAGRLG
jgi:molybdopterin molybdotransferase